MYSYLIKFFIYKYMTGYVDNIEEITETVVLESCIYG